MKIIKLTQGQDVKVDDGDYERLCDIRWRASVGPRGHTYAWGSSRQRFGGRRSVAMHRVILGIEQHGREVEVDHVNHDTLDNRRVNLRIVTRSQNMANRTPNQKSSSRYKGVTFRATRGHRRPQWRARIWAHPTLRCIGTYHHELAAAAAYNAAAYRKWGEFAFLNPLSG